MAWAPNRRPETHDPPHIQKRARLDAQTRADALKEAVDWTRPWQRAKRKELQRDREQQIAAASRWDAERVGAVDLRRPRRLRADPEVEVGALRPGLMSDDNRLSAVIGVRPEGLAGRDAWLTAASRVVANGLSPAAHAPELVVNDTGLDRP